MTVPFGVSHCHYTVCELQSCEPYLERGRTLSSIEKEMEREFVKSRLARLLYLAHCKHNKWEPRTRIDPWAYEYADISIEILGWDEEAVTRLSEVTA